MTNPSPADKIERRKVGSLKPYPGNARVHSDEQIDQIAASIEKWGWTIPVLIDARNQIIAGHARIKAAEQLGIDEVPVMVATGWSKAKKQAYVIADNKLAMNASWDDTLLAAELLSLNDVGFDMSLIGFSDEELAGISAGEGGLTDPDEVSVPPVNPVTVSGDVWLLGQHRLLCGDCTDADAVAKVLAGAKPHLMVTDPPYGVEYDANWRNEDERANGKAIGGSAVGKVLNDDRADWREAWALFPGDVAYVWHAGSKAHVSAESLESCGLIIRTQIIWAKSNAAIGRGDYHIKHEPCWYAAKEGYEDQDHHCDGETCDLEECGLNIKAQLLWAKKNGNYHPKHEPCWYAVRKGRKGHYCGGRRQTTVWDIDKPRKSTTGHSTQKPVECMRLPIVNNSKRGQAVYDPFLGSGTTIIAAQTERRHCYGLELDPGYCDVIVKRWQDFVGKAATLEGDGRTFEEVDTERYPPGKDSADCYTVAISEKRKKLVAERAAAEK